MPSFPKLAAVLLCLAFPLAGSTAATAAVKAPTTVANKKPPKHKKKKPKPRFTIIKNAGPFPAPAAPADLSAPCAGAGLVPDAGNLALVGDAVLCLINQERAKAGIGALTSNPILTSVAQAYTQVVIGQDHLEHIAPDGTTPDDRVLGALYVVPNGNYMAGENLGVAEGGLAVPSSIVAAWMNSPEHRANILEPGFQESGLGIALGVPASQSTGNALGVTFVHMFGVRGTDIRKKKKPRKPSISLGRLG